MNSDLKSLIYGAPVTAVIIGSLALLIRNYGVDTVTQAIVIGLIGLVLLVMFACLSFFVGEAVRAALRAAQKRRRIPRG